MATLTTWYPKKKAVSRSDARPVRAGVVRTALGFRKWGFLDRGEVISGCQPPPFTRLVLPGRVIREELEYRDPFVQAPFFELRSWWERRSMPPARDRTRSGHRLPGLGVTEPVSTGWATAIPSRNVTIRSNSGKVAGARTRRTRLIGILMAEESVSMWPPDRNVIRAAARDQQALSSADVTPTQRSPLAGSVGNPDLRRYPLDSCPEGWDSGPASVHLRRRPYRSEPSELRRRRYHQNAAAPAQ